MRTESQIRMLDLLDQAYRVPDDHDQLDALLRSANTYLFEHSQDTKISQDVDQFAELEPHIEKHVSRIEELMDRSAQSAKTFPAFKRHAQLIISKQGVVLTANEQAQALFAGLAQGSVDNLPLNLESIRSIRGLIAELIAGVLTVEKIVYLQIETDDPGSAFAYCRAVPLDEGNMGLHLNLSYVNWTGEMITHIRDAIGLTESEGHVLLGILKGKSQQEIANDRERSIDTVKAQAKAVLRKAGCAKMSDLSNLCTSIAYVVGLSNDEQAPSGDAIPWVTPKQNMHTMTLKDGRRLAYYEYGDPKGQPVLYLHGFFQGPFFLDQMKKDLLKNGLRIIAPSRPGFGYTSPHRKKTGYTQTCLQDALGLLAALDLRADILIATHHGSANHAFRLAAELGDAVKGLVMIGVRIPMTDEHISHMSQQARTISAASRHAPSIMKMVGSVGLKIYKQKGIRDFLETQWQPTDLDRQCLNNPARFEKIAEGIFHMTQQGADAFVWDGQAQMGDWTEAFTRANARQSWIHGRHCHVMGPDHIKEYVESKTNYQVEILEDAGFNIIYQAPEQVLSKIIEAKNW